MPAADGLHVSEFGGSALSRLFGVYALVCALALVLAGCNGGFSTVSNARVNSGYSAAEFHYVAGNQGMRVIIHNNPFFRRSRQDLVNRTVIYAMRGQHFGPKVNFTTYPVGGKSARHRVEMVFFAPNRLSGNSLCRGRVPRPDVPVNPGTITVLAVYCKGDIALTQARGNTIAFGPDDERFWIMIGRVTRQLFPRDPPNRRNDT